MSVESTGTPIGDQSGQFKHRPDRRFCLGVDVFYEPVEEIERISLWLTPPVREAGEDVICGAGS